MFRCKIKSRALKSTAAVRVLSRLPKIINKTYVDKNYKFIFVFAIILASIFI